MNVAAVESWLQEHAGLDASTLGAGVVARAAHERIEALRCARVEDYLAVLAMSAEERHTLIERVIVPETWFFRDRPALDALARRAVETWGPAHGAAVFNVLSVPCSTGEEAYSIAIAFALAGWPAARLRVDAVDISRENVARARAGAYTRNSFRGDDVGFREAFFDAEESGRWRVGERARAPVRFAQANLLGEDFAAGRGLYDAIFCRNLLIYFDRPTQARAIRTLDRLLAPDGWIAVGPAEPVLLFEHGFAALRVPSGFLLHRAPKPETRPPAARRHVGTMGGPAAAAHTKGIARATPSRPASASPSAVAAPSNTAKPTNAAPARAGGEAAGDTVATVRALADAGNLREAAKRGAALLERDGPSAELLYVLALVADAAGESARAEEFYRKVLFLQPRHAEALSHLALLVEKKGEARAARQLRERARRAQEEAE